MACVASLIHVTRVRATFLPLRGGTPVSPAFHGVAWFGAELGPPWRTHFIPGNGAL